jgi:hypothetical protein
MIEYLQIIKLVVDIARSIHKLWRQVRHRSKRRQALRRRKREATFWGG